jgi:hypothetical protein
MFRFGDHKILSTDAVAKPMFTEIVVAAKKMSQYVENVLMHRVHLINDVL